VEVVKLSLSPDSFRGQRLKMRSLHIPPDAAVLIVEGDLRRRHWFLSSMRIPQAYVARTTDGAIEMIDRLKPDFVALDFDLGVGIDTKPVAEYLRNIGFSGRIVIISENSFGQMGFKKHSA
jgi:hypothetical protein